MKVKILVEFDVPEAEDEDIARSAASTAAYEYLAFCDALGVNRGTEECVVHVEGHGKYMVRIGTCYE